MKSFLFLTGVLILLVLIGVGCAAQQGSGSVVVPKEPLPEKPADMEKPQYDENHPPEVVDDSKFDRVPMKAYEPGQVIVKFAADIDEAKIGDMLTQYNLAKIKALPLPGVYLVKILGDDSVAKVVETLSKEAAVVYAEPDFLMQTQ